MTKPTTPTDLARSRMTGGGDPEPTVTVVMTQDQAEMIEDVLFHRMVTSGRAQNIDSPRFAEIHAVISQAIIEQIDDDHVSSAVRNAAGLHFGRTRARDLSVLVDRLDARL